MEKQLGYKYTIREIIETLKEHNFMEIKGEGYIPLYERTEITDELHELNQIRTDTEIVVNTEMEKIMKKIKK